MDINEALRTLRNIADGLHASGCHWRCSRITESADAIEAAMREPVAEVFDTMPRRILWETVAIRDSHPPGTKLFAFPPDAAGEIERLKEEIEIAECLQDSQYLAGVTAGWNAANSDNPNEAKARIYKLREGRLKPLFAIREKRKARAALAGKEEPKP